MKIFSNETLLAFLMNYLLFNLLFREFLGVHVNRSVHSKTPQLTMVGQECMHWVPVVARCPVVTEAEGEVSKQFASSVPQWLEHVSRNQVEKHRQCEKFYTI